jgi:hypothetical protein
MKARATGISSRSGERSGYLPDGSRRRRTHISGVRRSRRRGAGDPFRPVRERSGCERPRPRQLAGRRRSAGSEHHCGGRSRPLASAAACLRIRGVVGSLGITPGGLGPVEGTLCVGLGAPDCTSARPWRRSSSIGWSASGWWRPRGGSSCSVCAIGGTSMPAARLPVLLQHRR